MTGLLHKEQFSLSGSAARLQGREPIRVLFCEAGSHGGSVKRLANLIDNIDRRIFRPAVFTCFNISKAGDLLRNHQAIPRDSMGLSSFPAPDVLIHKGSLPIPTSFGIRYFLKTLKVIHSVQPEIVYLNNTPFCHLPVIAAAALLKKKIICHMRDSIQLTRSEQLALKRLTRVITLSKSHKDFYGSQQIPKNKMVVVYNGIDLKAFDEACNEEVHFPIDGGQIIAFAGVLIGRKRQLDAVAALRILVSEFPRLKLLFLGDGPDRKMLQEEIKQVGLEENALFPGMVQNIAPYLKRCMAGLMLSDREGMPNVILEYMAAGLPVIATDLPGVREMVRHAITGFVVPVGDITAIVEGIRKLLFSDTRSCRMGKEGRKILESGRFTVQQEMDDIKQVLINAQRL